MEKKGNTIMDKETAFSYGVLAGIVAAILFALLLASEPKYQPVNTTADSSAVIIECDSLRVEE
jgi:hypothetical protein